MMYNGDHLFERVTRIPNRDRIGKRKSRWFSGEIDVSKMYV
jgi:hypothetical protein